MKANGMKSSGDMEALVVAAVLGKSLAEIARQAGTSVSSVQRRLKQPAVIAAINEARGRHRAEALGRMTDLRSQALDPALLRVRQRILLQRARGMARRCRLLR